MSNGTKRRLDLMSKVRKAELDIMSNGTKRRMEIMSKVRKADWDKMSTGTKKMSKASNAESKDLMSNRVQNVKKVRKFI
jgi:hypothetical protein